MNQRILPLLRRAANGIEHPVMALDLRFAITSTIDLRNSRWISSRLAPQHRGWFANADGSQMQIGISNSGDIAPANLATKFRLVHVVRM